MMSSWHMKTCTSLQSSQICSSSFPYAISCALHNSRHLNRGSLGRICSSCRSQSYRYCITNRYRMSLLRYNTDHRKVLKWWNRPTVNHSLHWYWHAGACPNSLASLYYSYQLRIFDGDDGYYLATTQTRGAGLQHGAIYSISRDFSNRYSYRIYLRKKCMSIRQLNYPLIFKPQLKAWNSAGVDYKSYLHSLFIGIWPDHLATKRLRIFNSGPRCDVPELSNW